MSVLVAGLFLVIALSVGVQVAQLAHVWWVRPDRTMRADMLERLEALQRSLEEMARPLARGEARAVQVEIAGRAAGTVRL